MSINAWRRLVAVLLLAFAPALFADSWAPASTQTYVSSDGNARVTIVPRPLGGNLSYFQDKVDGKDNAGQRPGTTQTHPRATLERKEAGRWVKVWSVDLINDVAPVSALVSDRGQLVTFDNWHSTGFGDDVVVVYDTRGALVRKLALTDIVSRAWIATFSRSVSSMHWGSDHVLDPRTGVVILHVAEPESDAYGADAPFVPVRLRLADGMVVPGSGPEWDRAMARVSALETERAEAWARFRAMRTAPLSPPTGSNDAQAWQRYRFELQDRLEEIHGVEYYGADLRIPGQTGRGGQDREDIELMLDMYFDNAGPPRRATFVSADSAELARVLARYLRVAKPGSKQGVHIAFVGTTKDRDKVVAAAKPSGATIEWIDASVPFAPGRPLPGKIPDGFLKGWSY